MPVSFQGCTYGCVGLTARFIKGFGLCFRLPVPFILLCKAGLIRSEGLTR